MKTADLLLTPARHLLGGWKISKLDTQKPEVESDDCNTWKCTAVSLIALAPSVMLGGSLKFGALYYNETDRQIWKNFQTYREKHISQTECTYSPKRPAREKMIKQLFYCHYQEIAESERNFFIRDLNDPTIQNSVLSERNAVSVTSARGPSLPLCSTLMQEFTLAIRDKEIPAQLYALFEGYNGAQASEFCAERILPYLKRNLEDKAVETLDDTVIGNAITATCLELDSECISFGGTTALFTLILDGFCYTANVGDSRAILLTSECPVTISEDAKSSNPRFFNPTNPLPAHHKGSARGIGAPSRILSARPKITKCDAKKGYVLLLACAGFWKTASSYEAGLELKKLLETETLSKAAEILCHEARSRTARDSICLISAEIRD